MELKVVNKEAVTLSEVFGISEIDAEILQTKASAGVLKLIAEEGNRSEAMVYIASQSNNLAEAMLGATYVISAEEALQETASMSLMMRGKDSEKMSEEELSSYFKDAAKSILKGVEERLMDLIDKKTRL